MPDPSKTEKATAKRREDSRKDGQVARSTEINSAAGMLLMLVVFNLVGAYMIDRISWLSRFTWSQLGTLEVTQAGFDKHIMDFGGQLLLLLLPMFLGILVIGILTNVIQVGFMFSTKVLHLKLENVSPLKGFKRIFSRRSVIEGFKGVLKVVLVGFVAWATLSGKIGTIMGLMHTDLGMFLEMVAGIATGLIFNIGLVLLFLAILDFAYQKYEFEEQIKMSKQEIKDEHKQMEGDPRVKARIRQVMREASRRRMMQDLPTADVVITNPTHLAVAVKYDTQTMDAPRVVAKGARLLAQKIKEVARENNIPVMENKPLARALFESTPVGAAVPGKLFGAVAELLAFVYQVQGTLTRKAQENRDRLRKTGRLKDLELGLEGS